MEQTPCGQYPPPKRERAGDDAPAPVDDLDRELSPSERGVERTRRRQHRGGRCSQLGDLDGSRVERAIKGTVEMARDEQIDAGSHDDDSEQDRERRRHHRPQPERQPTHRIRKPEPRTVSISGGSPSFARRYETYWSTTFSVTPNSLPQASATAAAEAQPRGAAASPGYPPARSEPMGADPYTSQ